MSNQTSEQTIFDDNAEWPESPIHENPEWEARQHLELMLLGKRIANDPGFFIPDSCPET